MSARTYYKLGLFCTFSLLLLWSIYYAGPTVVFYFDQKKGMAEITDIGRGSVKFQYHHTELDEEIFLVSRIGNLRDLEKLESKKNWEIVYSSHFPELVFIHEVHGKPGFQGIILISIFAITILLFRRFDFE